MKLAFAEFAPRARCKLLHLGVAGLDQCSSAHIHDLTNPGSIIFNKFLDRFIDSGPIDAVAKEYKLCALLQGVCYWFGFDTQFIRNGFGPTFSYSRSGCSIVRLLSKTIPPSVVQSAFIPAPHRESSSAQTQGKMRWFQHWNVPLRTSPGSIPQLQHTS